METQQGRKANYGDEWRSYRTYEEWKQETFETFALRALGSYRTYEEWKLLLSTTNGS